MYCALQMYSLCSINGQGKQLNSARATTLGHWLYNLNLMLNTIWTKQLWLAIHGQSQDNFRRMNFHRMVQLKCNYLRDWFDQGVSPNLKLIRQQPLVVVPSGKRRICGHLPPVAARRCISRTVFCRELGSSLETKTGCVSFAMAEIKCRNYTRLHYNTTLHYRIEFLIYTAVIKVAFLIVDDIWDLWQWQ